MAAGARQVATWSQIASWYDQLVRGGSGPHELALETTMRLVPDLRGARVLDVAGGPLQRHRFPDTGQMMTWQLYWEHTPMLVDDARGNSSDDIAAISRHDAEQITASLARRYWPPDAAQLPWVTAAYPR